MQEGQTVPTCKKGRKDRCSGAQKWMGPARSPNSLFKRSAMAVAAVPSALAESVFARAAVALLKVRVKILEHRTIFRLCDFFMI